MQRILLGMVLFGLLELALLVKAGEVFGTWFPLAAVLLSMIAGGLVIRHYGLKTFGRLREALRSGVPPAGHPLAGVIGLLAGILLILPGFLSDLAALALLIPVTRRIVASLLGWRLRPAGDPGRRRDPYGPVIEAEAVEIRGEMTVEQPVRCNSPWRR